MVLSTEKKNNLHDKTVCHPPITVVVASKSQIRWTRCSPCTLIFSANDNKKLLIKRCDGPAEQMMSLVMGCFGMKNNLVFLSV